MLKKIKKNQNNGGKNVKMEALSKTETEKNIHPFE